MNCLWVFLKQIQHCWGKYQGAMLIVQGNIVLWNVSFTQYLGLKWWLLQELPFFLLKNGSLQMACKMWMNEHIFSAHKCLVELRRRWESLGLTEDRDKTLSLHPCSKSYQTKRAEPSGEKQNTILSWAAGVVEKRISFFAQWVTRITGSWGAKMLGKAGYSLFLILPHYKLQFQRLPNTPPASKTPLVFLPLAGSDFLFPPLPVALPELGTEGGEGREPYSRASLAGTRAASSAWQPPLGFLLWLSQAGFHPLIHQNKRVCREERGSHYNPKGCCVNLSIAVFCSVALSFMWDYVTSLPCFTHLFFPLYSFFKAEGSLEYFPHASWKCCLQNCTTALCEIKYGLRQDQRLGVCFPSRMQNLAKCKCLSLFKIKIFPSCLTFNSSKMCYKERS